MQRSTTQHDMTYQNATQHTATLVYFKMESPFFLENLLFGDASMCGEAPFCGDTELIFI